MACRKMGYDREDRTTGVHAMDDGNTPMRWRAQFHKWCGLRFAPDGDDLKRQVLRLLEQDPTGAGTLDEYGPISTWDVSLVRSMEGVFVNAYEFNQPLDNWNVSNVRRMVAMFAAAREFNTL